MKRIIATLLFVGLIAQGSLAFSCDANKKDSKKKKTEQSQGTPETKPNTPNN